MRDLIINKDNFRDYLDDKTVLKVTDEELNSGVWVGRCDDSSCEYKGIIGCGGINTFGDVIECGDIDCSKCIFKTKKLRIPKDIVEEDERADKITKAIKKSIRVMPKSPIEVLSLSLTDEGLELLKQNPQILACTPTAQLETINDPNCSDPVNHPPHYSIEGVQECIEIIKGLNFGYLDGNAMKYLYRYKYKGKPVQDLKKCVFYLNKLIDELEAEDKDED